MDPAAPEDPGQQDPRPEPVEGAPEGPAAPPAPGIEPEEPQREFLLGYDRTAMKARTEGLGKAQELVARLEHHGILDQDDQVLHTTLNQPKRKKPAEAVVLTNRKLIIHRADAGGEDVYVVTNLHATTLRAKEERKTSELVIEGPDRLDRISNLAPHEASRLADLYGLVKAGLIRALDRPQALQFEPVDRPEHYEVELGPGRARRLESRAAGALHIELWVLTRDDAAEFEIRVIGPGAPSGIVYPRFRTAPRTFASPGPDLPQVEVPLLAESRLEDALRRRRLVPLPRAHTIEERYFRGHRVSALAQNVALLNSLGYQEGRDFRIQRRPPFIHLQVADAVLRFDLEGAAIAAHPSKRAAPSPARHAPAVAGRARTAPQVATRAPQVAPSQSRPTRIPSIPRIHR